MCVCIENIVLTQLCHVAPVPLASRPPCCSRRVRHAGLSPLTVIELPTADSGNFALSSSRLQAHLNPSNNYSHISYPSEESEPIGC